MPQDGATTRSPRQFKIVGTRPLRPDGIDKVTGKARFGADMYMPGMLYGFVLRSPHAHARIKRIDAASAIALDGVKAVLTSLDLPDHANGDQGLRDALENVMARNKALYDGHPVAAVAAVSPAIARQALKMIKVDYEVLMWSSSARSVPKPLTRVTSSRTPA
jgi:CO/xanthine dehydrogenase Mo-binding subunit